MIKMPEPPSFTFLQSLKEGLRFTPHVIGCVALVAIVGFMVTILLNPIDSERVDEPYIDRMLTGNDETRRAAANRLIGGFVSYNRAEDIVTALDDPLPEVQACAAVILINIAYIEDLATTEYLEGTRPSDPRDTMSTADAQAYKEQGLTVLTELFNDGNTAARNATIMPISLCCDHHATFNMRYELIWSDESGSVQLFADDLVDGRLTMEDCLKLLESENSTAQYQVICMLREAGPQYSSVSIDQLLIIAGEGKIHLVRSIAGILEDINLLADDHMTPILAMLESDDRERVHYGVEILDRCDSGKAILRAEPALQVIADQEPSETLRGDTIKLAIRILNRIERNRDFLERLE